MDTKTFIQNAKKIHGEKFDYSQVVYKNCDTKVKIFCKTCNTLFEQIPYSHINQKAGCIKCNHAIKAAETLEQRKNEFIIKATEMHGNKYDYSKVVYINSKTPVVIICTICNIEFSQIRNTHLMGDGGCKECQKIKCKNRMTFTREEFIARATQVHGDKFDYSDVVYVDSQTRITIRCIPCNYSFQTTPNNHLQGGGCKKCANKLLAERQRKPQELFISEAMEKHKDENGNPIYDYLFVEYKSCHEKVIIMCKTHGRFVQSPSDHLSGRGCNECGMINRAFKQTFTQEEFIERATEVHGDNYDYTDVKYINSQTKIIIKCNTCNFVFEQQPNSHLRGSGCDKCAHSINHENQKLSRDEIIERATKVHGDKFDYSNMNYINSHTPINIKCNNCNNNFQQLYCNHIRQNKGCPFCDCRITEKKIAEFLSAQYPNLIKEYKEEWCKNKRCLPFDFCLPDINTIIELDGLQHFKQVMNWHSPEENQKKDKYKMKCANENGFSVIRIIQTDVLYDKYDWKEELNKNIEKIIIEQKIQNIYICKNNEYEIYN